MKKALVCLVVGASAFAGRLDPLKDVREASPAIQQAAKAVVRVEAVDSFGTGFFISADGQMLTNEHVLGPDNCLKTGCPIKLAFDFQLGEKKKKSVEVFAVPLLTISELDATVIQIHELEEEFKPGKKFVPPHFLDLKSGERVSRHDVVIAVGHPAAAPKKWVEGKVKFLEGDWIHTNLMVLHGSSGSPVLNAAGRLVGIVHSGEETSPNIYRFDGARAETMLSSLTPAATFIDRHLKDPNQTTLEEYPELEDGETIEDAMGLPLDLLLKACEAELKEVEASNKPDSEFTICGQIFHYVNCNNPNDEDRLKKCPKNSEQKKWKALFVRIAEARELRNQDPTQWLFDAPALFEKSKEAAKKLIRSNLKKYYATHEPHTDADLIHAYARSANSREEMKVEGRDLMIELLNFRMISLYEAQSPALIGSWKVLAQDGILSKEESMKLLAELSAEEKFPADEILDLELEAYQLGLLD